MDLRTEHSGVIALPSHIRKLRISAEPEEDQVQGTGNSQAFSKNCWQVNRIKCIGVNPGGLGEVTTSPDLGWGSLGSP